VTAAKLHSRDEDAEDGADSTEHRIALLHDQVWFDNESRWIAICFPNIKIF